MQHLCPICMSASSFYIKQVHVKFKEAMYGPQAKNKKQQRSFQQINNNDDMCS